MYIFLMYKDAKNKRKKKPTLIFVKIYIDYGYGRICDHICSPMNFSIR